MLKSAGVGRVSINPQSMNDAVLAAIGRKHGSADVLRAFDEARQAGFDEINLANTAFQYTRNASRE